MTAHWDLAGMAWAAGVIAGCLVFMYRQAKRQKQKAGYLSDKPNPNTPIQVRRKPPRRPVSLMRWFGGGR